MPKKQNNYEEKEIAESVQETDEAQASNEEVIYLEENKATQDSQSDQAADTPVDDVVEAEGTEESEEEVSEAKAETEKEAVQDELSLLRAENEQLRAELAQSKRIGEQFAEFSKIFPEQSISDIPDEVWDQVKHGSSLAASFALFERKRINRETRAREINDLNAYRSSGYAGTNTVSEYLTPDEVRAMSQSEVRANYSRIIESMKKWN